MSAREGMQDFTMSLTDLVNSDLIDRAVALEVAPNVEALRMALKGIAVATPGFSDAAMVDRAGRGWRSIWARRRAESLWRRTTSPIGRRCRGRFTRGERRLFKPLEDRLLLAGVLALDEQPRIGSAATPRRKLRWSCGTRSLFFSFFVAIVVVLIIAVFRRRRPVLMIALMPAPLTAYVVYRNGQVQAPSDKVMTAQAHSPLVGAEAGGDRHQDRRGRG